MKQPQEIKGFNVLAYAANQQAQFNANMESLGHEVNTTFFSDLSIAECFGVDGIQDTFNRVLRDWGDNVVYFAEFCICLNHKIWAWYQKNDEYSILYDRLWKQADEYAVNHFKGDDLTYYYDITD